MRTVFRARRVLLTAATAGREGFATDLCTARGDAGGRSLGERPAAVLVEDGRIAEILPFDAPLGPLLDDPLDVTEIVLADDEVLIPGLVDTHVHVNEPGRTEWEGFASATRAAAAGGVTTIVDMPLNSLPPTLDASSLEIKRKAADGQCSVDVGFWGGAVPGNESDLAGLLAAGAFGAKCFLLDSGVPEFPPLPDPRGALRALGDAVLLAHAEDARFVGSAEGPRYTDFLASRPPAAEDSAIEALLRAAQETGGRVHVVHLSSAAALPLLAQARAEGVRVTVETCPHYLALTAEEVPDGDTRFKCCPPVREEANRDLLWQGLADGVIDMIVSDHSPATPELKGTGDFGSAWGGIASLQIGLPVVWTEARGRGWSFAAVVERMAVAPADLVGLRHKGRIAVGADADLAVVAPDEAFTVGALAHRHPTTPYAGRTLRGVVRGTWLRGERVDPDRPHGRLIRRGDT